MRSCGYAYTAQIKKKGNFGMRESMKWEERGDFPEKKFLGIKKYKILCDLSCASRRWPLGVASPILP